MRRLLESLDVDYDQWRALTRTLLRMDIRTTNAGAGSANFAAKTQQQVTTRLVAQGVTYLFLGVAAAIMVFFLDDVMLSASLVLTYVMFMVGLMVLVDHQSVITSPDDYMVLGSRPVSSRTYFAVRLTNVLVYTLALTTVYGIVPMLAFGAAHGFHPLRFLAAIPAFYLSTTLVALALVLSYASLLRVIGAGRLARILSYAQLFIGVLLYGAYMLPGQMVQKARFIDMKVAMPSSPWVLLFPPTWFASYLSIASGAFGLRQVLPAVASIAALLAVSRALGGRLSLDYASRLGEILSATAPASGTRRRRRPWMFRSGERRVVSLLIRAQFRNDQKFRMAVLGVLPMTIIYMFLAFQNGPPGDPFGGSVSSIMSWLPLTMAVFFFPMMLRMTLTTSDAYRASWIYFGTPVSRARILGAQTDVLTASFIVPYLCVVGAIMGYFSGHFAGVFTHMAFLGLASRLMLQVVTALAPTLPFSRPMQKMGRTTGVITWLFLGLLAGVAIGPLLVVFVYVSVARMIFVGALFVGASVAIDRLTRVRLGEQAEQLEFEGAS